MTGSLSFGSSPTVTNLKQFSTGIKISSISSTTSFAYDAPWWVASFCSHQMRRFVTIDIQFLTVCLLTKNATCTESIKTAKESRLLQLWSSNVGLNPLCELCSAAFPHSSMTLFQHQRSASYIICMFFASGTGWLLGCGHNFSIRVTTSCSFERCTEKLPSLLCLVSTSFGDVQLNIGSWFYIFNWSVDNFFIRTEHRETSTFDGHVERRSWGCRLVFRLRQIWLYVDEIASENMHMTGF